MSLGVWLIQSSTMKVVLRLVSSHWQRGWAGDLPNLVKVGIVKDQEVLVLIGETLDGVGGSLGEVPDITIVKDFFLVSAILIDGGNENGTLIDNAPFSLYVLVRTSS